MAERKCRICDGWHDLDEPWPFACVSVSTVARSSLPIPMVISDSMPETEHVDGQFYTSKAKFREVTKANGLVEVGNDPSRLNIKGKPKPDRQKIRQSLEKAIARVKSGERVARA